MVVHAEPQSSSKSSGANTSATSRATRSEERAAALVVHAESQSSSKSSGARTERTAASTVANSSATPLSKCSGARSISSYTNASPLLEEAVAVITVRDSPQSSGVPSVVNAIVSPTASGAGRTEALDLANQSLLRLISLIQEWNINLSELGESALTLDAFFKQKSLQSGVTIDKFMDGDKGKGMEFDEDGSVPINVRSDARGDVVFDEEVVAKGVTVDTVVDGDKGNDIEVGSVPVTVRSDARVGVVDTVVDGDEGKGMEVDEDGSVQVDEDGSVPVDTLVDGDEGKKDMGVNVDVSENQTSVNACTFSSADDIKIYQIGNNIRNKFVITSAAGMRFQASVLSLYVHALRVHFMSRRYFATRKIYLDLAKTETYQKHKDNFFLLDQGNLDIDVFKNKHKFENYIGVETLTKAMASMFPKETGFHPTLIQNFSLPRKPCCTNLISTTFSEFIAEQQQQHPAADLSIIFVDFTTSDKIRGAPTVVDFPNRVLVSTVGVYQTVGALYSVIDADCTSSERYACRILNRGQLDCEYSIHECLFREGKYITTSTPAKLNFIKNWDDSKIHNVDYVYTRNVNSMFPAMFTHKKTPYSIKYELIGVVMCLNDGQKEGSLGFHGRASLSIPNALSRLEPIGQYGDQFIYHREMYILTGKSNEWLSDEIVNSCCKKYTEFVASRRGNFGRYIPPFVFQSLLQHLHPSTNLQSTRSKSQKDTLDESEVRDAYLYSKNLWVYQNIFDDPNTWFFSVINYPNQKHWIYIGIHASEHTIIVYDPLRNRNNTDIVGSVVQAYANCDFAEALEQNKADTSEIPKWIQLHVDGQLQEDSHNCGVLSLISFFRGIRKLNELGTECTAANLAARWKCGNTIDAFTAYRKNLLKLILSESSDSTAFEYFYNVLQDYISSGQTLFE